MGARLVAGPVAKQSRRLRTSISETKGNYGRNESDVSPGVCAGQLGSTLNAFAPERRGPGATGKERPGGEERRRRIVRSLPRTVDLSGLRRAGETDRLRRPHARPGRRTQVSEF